VEPRGFLEYLPEPRILFPDASLDHVLDLDCAANGSAIVSDAFTVQDPIASRRGFRHFRSVLTVHRGDDLTAVDRSDLTSIDRWLRRGRSAFGTIAMVAELEPEQQHHLAVAITRSLASVPGLYGAGSVLPDDAGVAVRLAGRDLRSVRGGLGLVRNAFRVILFGSPGSHRVDAMKLGLHDQPAQIEVGRATGPPRADHIRLETSDPVNAACSPTGSPMSMHPSPASTRGPRPAC
jgi:urease accessory protein